MRAEVFCVMIIAFYTYDSVFRGSGKHKQNPANIPCVSAGSQAICPLQRSWPLSDIYGPMFITVSRDPVCSLSSPSSPSPKMASEAIKIIINGTTFIWD